MIEQPEKGEFYALVVLSMEPDAISGDAYDRLVQRGFAVRTGENSYQITDAGRERLNDFSQQYLTTAHIEKEFNLAPGSAKKAAQLGKVPAIKPGHDWLIKRSDAEAKWGHRKTPKNEGDAPLDKSR